MVKENKQALKISWEENFTAEDDHHVSALIVRTITADLPEVTDKQNRLYFIVPTPAPYQVAEEELLQEISGDNKNKTDIDSFFRVTRLGNGATCYVISGTNNFRKIIPATFRLGPPELTLLAANCPFGLNATLEDLSEAVLTALKSEQSPSFEFTGMHFDSGDLIDLFDAK